MRVVKCRITLRVPWDMRLKNKNKNKLVLLARNGLEMCITDTSLNF